MTPRAILETLPSTVKEILETAKTCVTPGNLYLVGGLVRDVLLGNTAALNDIDLVVEHVNASTVAFRLHKKLGGTLECREAFGTCTLNVNNFVIDVVTARRERYDPPGTLPKVSFSTIEDDLARRDFGVNALALRLMPEPLELLDTHQGMHDLRHKKLRVLHDSSFLDDPTRILRGSRLAGRLGFSWEAPTRMLVDQALTAPTLQNVSKDRFKQELELTFAEKSVTPCLNALQECNALEILFGLTPNSSMTTRLDKLRQTLDVAGESYLLTLLLMKHESDVQPWLTTFNYPLRYFESVQRLREIEETNQVSSQQFTKLSNAEKLAIRGVSDALDKRIQELTVQFKERRLSGQDVLDLGLESGPEVGTVLAHVAKARDAGEVCTFDDELALAQRLARELVAKQ
jgi:tRNA nucleotidyltransferase (CCA-adding enzyme)